MTASLPDFNDPISDLPFPLASFPPALAEWLEDTALQARVPVAFIAFPFLAFTGAVLGNQVSLQIGPGWTERPTLWVALVAPTGHGKTPAIAAARRPFTTLHSVGSDGLAIVDSILMEIAAGRELPEDQRPPQEEPPPDWAGDEDIDFEHLTEGSPLFTASSRIDSLVSVLSSTCGLCLLRDELASLIHTIDRGRAEDHQTLLSLWSSEPLYPSNPNLRPLLNPVLAIVGGLQPRLFHRFRGTAQDGLL